MCSKRVTSRRRRAGEPTDPPQDPQEWLLQAEAAWKRVYGENTSLVDYIKNAAAEAGLTVHELLGMAAWQQWLDKSDSQR